ncbi:MAG TPA: hypothetical protein VFY38_16250 [Pseudonocardia sp.]|nr:hypothetical protein [Pseudonocardia sp.]
MSTDVSPSRTAGVASRRRTSPALLAAVGLYAAAAGHVIAALVHLSHGWNITAFFLLAAAVQVVVAGRVGRGTAAAGLVVAVLLGTLGLVLLYIASRTLNLPFGGVHTVHNDRPQDPELLGTAVVLAELITLATAPALLPEPLRRWSTTSMMLVGAGLWAAWATGLV